MGYYWLTLDPGTLAINRLNKTAVQGILVAMVATFYTVAARRFNLTLLGVPPWLT